ncbi:glycosyltransferase family 61 protein [Cyanobium gracile]|uniref:Glycosyltransferase 61 catalytic domain-containing protein n=1 Tax=Cyanobium gracile (strain ATCC 27147 / PCC 6307) TaxID=292564 RepID=K9P9H6_CYAGP|nr:glycosyltransferase family 61 protein [Cyanobium gracile]AFY29234.1 hypothetical protein Cyagr_2115 [Cyanobium gracile PCC 6307]
MSRQLLTETRDILALPSFPVALQGRPTEGLFWDPRQDRVVLDALPAISTPPGHHEVQVDAGALASASQSHADQSRVIEPTAIFGGYLLRHFGHFLHESLSRLWWLGQGKSPNSLVEGVRRRLQAEGGDVVFFMPHWLDDGKDLPAYMAEVLTGLGLPIERIRILVEPAHLRHLLIPAQCWGFRFDQPAWNEELGCDCRELMRNLLGSYDRTAAPGESTLPSPEKLYVTRTGLPLQLGRLIGDVFLDRLMEAAGFRIYHPERHSIAEQIRQYSHANELVFMDGSALYLLWFCRLRPGVRIRVILRRRQGAWMCDQVKLLLPATAGLRWQVVDALKAESLTSENDWESHNLANISALAHQLAPKTHLPREQIRHTLTICTEELVANLDAAQLAGVLQALLYQLLPPSEPPISGTRAQLRRLAGRLKRRLTSP